MVPFLSCRVPNFKLDGCIIQTDSLGKECRCCFHESIIGIFVKPDGVVGEKEIETIIELKIV